MYHAESFANNGYETFVVGYRGASFKVQFKPQDVTRLPTGSKPTPALLSAPHVQFCYLAQLPRFFAHLPFMIVAPIKLIHQVLVIFFTLLFSIPNAPEFIVAQVKVSRSCGMTEVN